MTKTIQEYQVTTTNEDLLSVTVLDQVQVGCDKILESLHVSEGPGRIATSPVPSIFTDDRGEIHRIRVGGKRVNMIFSKKDTMRSGYLHPSTAKAYVVSGRVQVWALNEHGTSKTSYDADQAFFTPPYVPHVLFFLEDSVILEYWQGDATCYYYHPYRRLVELQNSLVAGKKESVSHFRRLLPEDYDSSNGSNDSVGRAWLLATASLLMGIALGSILTASSNVRRK